MKTPNSKIESAAAKKDVPYYLLDAWLDVEKRRIVSTDGHICAIVPVELDDGDVSGPISIEVLKQARKTKSSSIKANGVLSLDNGATFPRDGMDNKYPDVDRIVPNRTKYTVEIALDASLLLRLAEAVNDQTLKYSHNLKLHITGPLDAVKVTGNIEGAVGVIMPARV
jgi:hypothetical protein